MTRKDIIRQMDKKISLRIWAPRILSIVFVLFLMMFSLDVFDSSASVADIIIGLLVHNIPALVLLAAVLVSWKYEIVGGIIFTLAGIAYIALMIKSGLSDGNQWLPILMIAFPAFVIGILFTINFFKKNR